MASTRQWRYDVAIMRGSVQRRSWSVSVWSKKEYDCLYFILPFLLEWNVVPLTFTGGRKQYYKADGN